MCQIRNKASSLAEGLSDNRQVVKRNRALQRKVSLIIATDFSCWVPFVVVCGLHYLQVLDASPWYATFSIVILPINSVINPVLYDDTIAALQVRFKGTISRARGSQHVTNVTLVHGNEVDTKRI